MLIKRSVSPDGRIDSLSVELSHPVGGMPEEAILDQAQKTLGIQSQVVASFLGNGQAAATAARGQDNGTVEAVLRDIDAMETKYGRRLFINVGVGNKTLKFFGSEKQLSEALVGAGYEDHADAVQEGLLLNLPCQVITKPSDDGRYTNVVKLVSSSNGEAVAER